MSTLSDKAQSVKEQFGAISPRYDFLNSLLSFGMDRYWRKVATRELVSISGEYILDICAGTLPLTTEWIKMDKNRVKKIVALDFCLPMLLTGRERTYPLSGRDRIHLLCGDAQGIPFPDACFHGIMVAFGVRNFSSRLKGLREMHRVLKPGGKAVILEFSRPANPIFNPIYMFYLRSILPVVGGVISGHRKAYDYLYQSINAFYGYDEWISLIKQAGFVGITYRELTLGIVSLCTCTK
jgi:demethylmenaquinone methyltransferase/2-methoxy-6-polyprenyl-1,4-benzoquinol methylase